MKKVFALVVSVGVLGLFAEESDGADDIHIVGEKSKAATSVYLQRRADYLAVPVMISLDPKAKNKEQQVYFARKAAGALAAAAAKGRSPLIIRFVGLSRQPYLYLMTPLEGEIHDAGYYVKKVDALYKRILFRGKPKCRLGSPVLAVKDPEKYRNDIIAKIIYSVEKLTATLKSKMRIEISGLERAVVVRGVDDEHVNLHIPYGLTIEIERGDSKQE